MKYNDFIIKKLHSYAEDLVNMNEEEKIQFMDFMINVAIHNNERLINLTKETNDINMSLASEVEFLKKDIKHLEQFIKDMNLGSQFRFYSRGREVI